MPKPTAAIDQTWPRKRVSIAVIRVENSLSERNANRSGDHITQFCDAYAISSEIIGATRSTMSNDETGRLRDAYNPLYAANKITIHGAVRNFWRLAAKATNVM